MERPLLELMKQRSATDWGANFLANPEYRRLRWPCANRVATIDDEQESRENVEFRANNFNRPVVAGEIIRQTPYWLSELRADLRYKSDGSWNSRGRNYNKPSTRERLLRDLKHCMSLNIPFRTNSVEYKPSDTTIYVRGSPLLKYNLETGTLESFCYQGSYHKVKSLILRMFGIYVVKRNRQLVWEFYQGNRQRGNPEETLLTIDVPLTRVMNLQEGFEAAYRSFTASTANQVITRVLSINYYLRREYVESVREARNGDNNNDNTQIST